MQANRIGLVLSTTTTERPPSAPSVRFTTRQRLQQSTLQRIYHDTNGNSLSTLDSPKKSRRNSSVEEISDTPKVMQNFPPTNSLQNLIFKNINRGTIEVSQHVHSQKPCHSFSVFRLASAVYLYASVTLTR